MSARFWKVTFLGCVGLQTLAALTTIALEASTYRFEKEHAGRKFVLSHNEDDSLLMIDYIPPGLGERGRRIAIGTSLSCIKLAIIVVAFTLFANTNRKRWSVTLHPLWMIIWTPFVVVACLGNMTFCLGAHGFSTHFKPNSVARENMHNWVYGSFYDLETWTCDMSTFAPQRHVFKPQCDIAKVTKGFIIAECVIAGLFCVASFMCLSDEKRRYEQARERKKIKNRPYMEDARWH